MENENSTLVSGIIDNVVKYGTDPALLQRDALETIRKALNNEFGLISAENPVALLLEMSAAHTSGYIGKNWLLNRRQYPINAQTHEDLYYHLSDLDWVGVFGLPAKATFTVSLSYDELLQSLKPLENNRGDLLRIPRGMMVRVGGVSFMLDYPVDILRLKNGSFRITYDTKEKSPIQTLSSNIVEHEINANLRDLKRIHFKLEMIQVREKILEENITANINTSISHTFNDYFYYARVYTNPVPDQWKELLTTHSPDVYDVYRPTAVLKLIENVQDYTLTARIPAIYNSPVSMPDGLEVKSTLGDRMKIHVYTTMGAIDINLGAYGLEQFEWDFYPKGLDSKNYDEMGVYSSALQSLQDVMIFSNDHVNQGRDPLTFTELRDRVILNTVGPNDVPVSHQSILDKLQDNQFSIIKSIDYVTNRAYWATRKMPAPTSTKLLTSAAASIETLITTTSNLVGTGTVKDNSNRLTILPSSLYVMENGRLSILDKVEIERINSLSTDNKAKEINSKEYYYTPFHYVLDLEDETIKSRAYYLDNPKAITKYYNDSNLNLPFSLTIGENYFVYRTERGYVLRVTMKSDESYKSFNDDELWAELLVKPFGDNNPVYLKGTMVGRSNENEPIFEFELQTQFDIDDSHCLIVNNLSMMDSMNMDVTIALNNDFELLFGFYGQMEDWKKIDLDNKIGRHLLNDDAKVILSESIRVVLGQHMKYLWTRTRTYAADVIYRRHEEDVPLLYQEDVYEQDPVTGSIINIVDGEVRYNIIHRKGEQVRDPKGNLVYINRVGDIYLDSNGRPVVDSPRKTIHRIELMLIDGTYLFANDEITNNYRDELVNLFIDWVVTDLAPINDKTLEQTAIYYYPSSTMGQVKVMYNDGVETYINAAQTLHVDFTVSRQVYSNPDVLQKIRQSTIRVLNEEIGKETVSISSMIKRLVLEHGDDVIGLNVRNLGGDDRIVSYTILDEGKRTSLRKKLNVQSDETLNVVESVSFNFIVHSPEEEMNNRR